MKAAGKRRKGNAGERELVEILFKAGIGARRVPLSGAMKDTGFGGDVLVADPGSPLSEEKWEVKRRAQGFKKIYAWLQDAAVLAFRGDREEWIVVMRLEDYIADRTYSKNWVRVRYPGKITMHWLRAAFDRIAAGEKETEVMKDYGYCKEVDR